MFMFQAILIDDEPFALIHLEKILVELAEVEILATFTDPVEATQALAHLNPNVIFLDIEMPEMNGMEAAEIIHNLCPAAEIIFVTAYKNFALDAFELNALDYVLKPLQRGRLLKTVKRLEERMNVVTDKTTAEHKVTIYCFDTLRFETEGQPPQTFRWRTAKTQELFSYLLHHRNGFVSKDTLVDMLWPNIDFKKASAHLYTTIYQLRKSLKQENIDVSIDKISGKEGYVLNPQQVQIGTDIWEREIRNLGSVHMENYEKHQKLIDLYTGDYFGDCDYIWAESERQRLRTVWLHHAMQVAEFYTDNNMITSAATVYQRIVQLQPYFEEGHLGLMKIYDHLKARAAVEKQFSTIQNLLLKELGVELPESIQSWYTAWKQRNR
ncbi:response regulator [Paenibacillaceae bacterium]|nr:response regulator [Paenibacillaceae bacterium]